MLIMHAIFGNVAVVQMFTSPGNPSVDWFEILY